ncbi:MAG: helicase-related protein [Oscillospiraceae bacterium]
MNIFMMKLDYQLNAIAKISKIVDDYGGIFISDVVGLGKTYISAMYAQTLQKNKLILCPPPVIDNWKGAFRDFGVKKYEIESIGMLHKVIEDIKHGKTYDYIFVDEAHRFRNGETSQYELLKRICLNKKVILISATPLNNSFFDFKALITLFQKANDCDIPGIPGRNLEVFFASKKNQLKEVEKKSKGKSDPIYINEVKNISKEVRDKILNHIMIRRTRTDIKKHFSKDLKKQGLFFPEVLPPEKIIYEFDDKTNTVFENTIDVIKNLTYARYTPKLYLKAEQLSAFEKTQQTNMKGFMKSRLVKRLESSKYAFQMTLSRMINSYEKYIEMYNSGYIYISKDVDVFDYIDSDDTAKLDQMLNSNSDKKVEKFAVESFEENFLINLKGDIELLKETYSSWLQVDTDFKKQKFIKTLDENELLKNSKLVIFTESKETGDDLFESLKEIYGQSVLFYSSTHSSSLREVIKDNFDPNNKIKADDIRILITTDVLAEGINLHRSNIIINYDLPWNPTRVLQRAGRVNRVGTEHRTVHTFNFFPTAKTDAELDLESNIIAKIQAFHNALGEDAKYLSEEEEFTSFNLRGANLYKTLNQGIIEDEEENLELKYLSIIRGLRDKETSLFKKIGELPKKTRTAKEYNNVTNDSLITFFRKGKLKKFCVTQGLQAQEVSFNEAVKYFECKKDETKKQVPKNYFELLASNKKVFEMNDIEDEMVLQKGRSNQKNVVKTLKSLLKEPKYTQAEIEFVQQILKAYQLGTIPSAITKKLKTFMDKEFDNLKLLSDIKNIVPNEYLNLAHNKQSYTSSKNEIVLSEFLYKK